MYPGRVHRDSVAGQDEIGDLAAVKNTFDDLEAGKGVIGNIDMFDEAAKLWPNP